MGLSEFSQSAIAVMFFIVGMLVVFGLQPNNNILSVWSDGTFETPGQIGPTDINTTLEGSPYATQASTGVIEENNPFLNLASNLGIVPKIAFTFQALASSFADSFSFLPEEIRWGLGLPLLAIMTIGLVFFLLNAAGISKGGGV